MRLLLIIVMVSSAPIVFAADCDCTHFPIRPEACVQACRVALLQRMSKDGLVSSLNIDASTAEAVVKFRDSQKIQSVDMLNSTLTPDKVAEIKSKLDELSASDATALAKQYGFSKVPSDQGSGFDDVFDTKQAVTIAGTVTRVEFRNPKVQVYVDSKDESGKVTSWIFEGQNPGMLMRRGWTRNSVKVGDEVVVNGYLSKSSSHDAALQSLKTTDGRTVFTSSSAGTF